MCTRNAAMSTARRNEFSRESANDCGTHNYNNIILYNTIRAVIQSDERTPVRPSRTTDRECATSRVAGKPPSSWTTKKKKNNHLRPGGWARRRMPARLRPPAAHRRASPSPGRGIDGARATETRRRAGRRRDGATKTVRRRLPQVIGGRRSGYWATVEGRTLLVSRTHASKLQVRLFLQLSRPLYII